jgi:signal transduction histidine kinase
MTSLLTEIKDYVGFTDEDSASLRGFLPVAEPHLERIAGRFYDAIERHAGASRVLSGPEQIERLKRTLVEWMRSGLEGPHDEAFRRRRARIGRTHVRIALPQRYMFTAMNVVRLEVRALVEEAHAGDHARRRSLSDAVDKLLDLELAIMLESYREDSDARLRARERLATVGQVAAGIAHDLRNPLGVIESSLYLVGRYAHVDERLERHLRRISEQVELCGGIISDLLEMTRSRKARPEPVAAGDLLGEALARVTVPDGIEVEREVGSDVELLVERRIMAQAVANLVDNAFAASETRPATVTVRAFRDDRATVLEVVDGGVGFDPDILGRAFEPLVTGRSEGTGLGLALVKNIVDRHGGEVEAGNRQGGGAYVRVRIPDSERERS